METSPMYQVWSFRPSFVCCKGECFWFFFEQKWLGLPVEDSPTAETPLRPQSNPSAAEIDVDSGSSSGEEKALEEGWQVFRARKKRSGGSGSPQRPKTRTQVQEVNGQAVGKAGEGSVSTPYWEASAHGTSGLVSQPANVPHLENYSKFKSGVLKEGYPNTNLEKGKKRKETNGSFSVLGDRTRQENLKSDGPPPDSSAGHTPYPSRPIKARDLRIGKVGGGPNIMSKNSAHGGIAISGPSLGNLDQIHHLSGLDFWAGSGSSGPAVEALNQINSGSCRSAISRPMVQSEPLSTSLLSHQISTESMHAALEQVEDIPSVRIGSSMQLFENPDSMGCEELENPRSRGARRGSGKG